MTTTTKRVKTIPASKRRTADEGERRKPRRRVAAYARVSTDKEEQQTSYESQIDFYTRYIQGRDDWEFAGVYTDEGITGASTKHREGFKSMVASVLSGQIDLIITKSVSRFARNTVDSLTTIRELKDAGVEVYFEKENIWTFDGKGELLLTIMSSIAQEESRSISENCKWGKRKLLAEGHAWIPFGRFFGYDKGSNGELVVNPEQAKIVRRIYDMFLGGMLIGEIARTLTAEGIKTPGGKDKWRWGTVNSILTNEKYKGDALLQKNYTPDFLTKKQLKNNGEVPQYYVEGNHEAIIDPVMFDAVQCELERRRSSYMKKSTKPFTGKVRCGVCGALYGRKIWHSTSKSRKYMYQCNAKYATKPPCQSTHVYEDRFVETVISIMNELLANKKDARTKVKRTMREDMGTAALESERKKLLGKGESEDAERRLAEIEEEIERRKAAKADAAAFLDALAKAPGKMKGLNERLWHALVDHATMHEDGSVSIAFKGGFEMGAE